MLQSYIFYIGIENSGVNEFDLVLSLCISVFTFVYNLQKLRRESAFHGMPFSEYALSVLQLGLLLSLSFCHYRCAECTRVCFFDYPFTKRVHNSFLFCSVCFFMYCVCILTFRGSL